MPEMQSWRYLRVEEFSRSRQGNKTSFKIDHEMAAPSDAEAGPCSPDPIATFSSVPRTACMIEKPSQQQSSAPAWARVTLMCAVLYFPVCGLALLPLGGAGRYLSVLAGPLATAYLLVWHRYEWRDLAIEAWNFAAPFLPWVVASLTVIVVYPNATIGDPFSRVFWALTIMLAATRARMSRQAIFSAAAAASLLYFAIAAYQLFIAHHPRAGLDTNPIVFAETAMLISGLALAASQSSLSSRPAVRVLWFVLGCMGLTAVAFTYARGPMLALIVLVLLLIIDSWRRRQKTVAMLSLVGAVTAISAILLFTPFGERARLVGGQAADYLATHADQSSVGIRLEFWRIALDSIADRPLLGYGYTNVLELSSQIPALRFVPLEMLERLHHFHSDWFHALMAGGLVLVLGLAGTVTTLAWRARHDLPRLWLLGAMLVFGLTDLAFFRKPTVTLFIAAWALLSASPGRPEHGTEAHIVHR